MSLKTASPTRTAARILVWGAVIVAIVVFLTQLPAFRSALAANIASVTLLRAAMSAARGEPVDTEALERLSIDPEDLTGLQARAQAVLAAQADRPEAVEQWLSQGVQESPSAFLTQFELCRFYWQAEQYERAYAACKDTGASAEYWLQLAYQANRRDDWAEAEKLFTMAVSVDPALAAAWYQLGLGWNAEGRYLEAVGALERVLALQANPPAEAYAALGLAYAKTGNRTVARNVINRGLLAYPSERILYREMARAFWEAGEPDIADEWYQRLLQRWPNDAYSLDRRGAIALTEQRYLDAVAHYREAARIEPEDANHWLQLAAAAAASGDASLASEAYERALALRPDDTRILLQAGRYMMNNERPERAQTLYEHVLALEPDNNEASSQLAILQALDGGP